MWNCDFTLAEIALKSRKEIADYLSQNKDDRARIRVCFLSKNFDVQCSEYHSNLDIICFLGGTHYPRRLSC